MAKLVSKTYGDALFEVALEKNQLDEFLDEVKAAQTAIEENKELFKLMSHPKIVKIPFPALLLVLHFWTFLQEKFPKNLLDFSA